MANIIIQMYKNDWKTLDLAIKNFTRCKFSGFQNTSFKNAIISLLFCHFFDYNIHHTTKNILLNLRIYHLSSNVVLITLP